MLHRYYLKHITRLTFAPDFKKYTCMALLAFAGQLCAYQSIDNSTFVFTDLLLWQLREGSADNWAQEISPAGVNQPINVLSVPFNWNGGLRVGAGRNYGNWDTVVSYTWFNTKGSSQASVTSGGIYSPFLGNFYINNIDGINFGPNYRNASIQWNFHFNIFDLEFGRPVKVDEFLKLRPFVGLKGGSINQSINSAWQNPTVATNFTSATEDLKNDFWGLGPVIGLDTTWVVYRINAKSFNIFGNFSGGLLWGHWHFEDEYANNAPVTDSVHLDNVNGAATMARALLGVEWKARYPATTLSIRLGYEAQVWFNQIQYYSLNMGRLNNLMSLQGGVLGFCFYF
jgi:hypothetical protein